MEWIEGLQITLLVVGILALLALAVALAYVARILRSISVMTKRLETISNLSHWWRVACNSQWLLKRLNCIKKSDG